MRVDPPVSPPDEPPHPGVFRAPLEFVDVDNEYRLIRDLRGRAKIQDPNVVLAHSAAELFKAKRARTPGERNKAIDLANAIADLAVTGRQTYGRVQERAQPAGGRRQHPAAPAGRAGAPERHRDSGRHGPGVGPRLRGGLGTARPGCAKAGAARTTGMDRGFRGRRRAAPPGQHACPAVRTVRGPGQDPGAKWRAAAVDALPCRVRRRDCGLRSGGFVASGAERSGAEHSCRP